MRLCSEVVTLEVVVLVLPEDELLLAGHARVEEEDDENIAGISLRLV
jgi:hypothetical protein